MRLVAIVALSMPPERAVYRSRYVCEGLAAHLFFGAGMFVKAWQLIYFET